MPRNETKTDQWCIPDPRGIDPKDQGTRPQAAPSPEMGAGLVLGASFF